MKGNLQVLEDEIFEKYPNWCNKLIFKDYLSGAVYGKGSPYAIVETPFGLHQVSVGNLRKGNYPTKKTATDQNEYDKNYSVHMIKILGEELFLLNPEWENELELIQYIQGKNYKLDQKVDLDGGPFLKVRTEIGIHIVPVSRLRNGYFPSLNSAIELFTNEVKELNYTDARLLNYYTVMSKINEISEISEYLDISQVENKKLEQIEKEKNWYLVKDIINDEYFYQRRVSIVKNRMPSIKLAFNEASLLNKITPNYKRQNPIKIIKRIGKIRDELSYEIEWCGCLFVKELSWIINKKGREPRRLKGCKLSLGETANKVFQFRNPEMAVCFTIKEYLPNKKHPRVILSDNKKVTYDFRWSDILAGKTPGMRSATYMPDYIYREMKEENSALCDKIEILSFAETKGKSNARLIKVKYLLYDTIHEVYKSVLISGENLTIESAIDPLDFVCKKIKVDSPDLDNKIEILEIGTKNRITKRSNREKESQVLIKVLKTQVDYWVPLTYLQKNHYLCAILGEWSHLPIHAIIKIDPTKLLNVYFIQMIHTSGIQSYKIGWTLHDTPAKRVKTMGNGWLLHSCICFELQTAIDIYEFERAYKKIPTPEIPKEYRPNNGFTELIWHEILAEKWELLSKAKMTFEEVKDLLKNI